MKGPTTELIDWRGGRVEFCRSGNTRPADPPWWVVRYKDGPWGEEWSYIWIDYGGPPQVFLTKKEATAKAKRFKEQYGDIRNYQKHKPLKVEVVKLVP